VVTVGPPKMGEDKPAFVMADVTFNIGKCTEAVQREWDYLRPRDSLFLVSVQRGAGLPEYAETPDSKLDSIQVLEKYGVKLVRGGEINALIGDTGRPLEEFHTADAAHALMMSKKLDLDPGLSRHGVNAGRRTYRMLLDPNQYVTDISNERDGGVDVYASNFFNIVVRRQSRANNFKSVLETIRDLIRSAKVVVPSWLHDVFLGYGDPSAANYTRMGKDFVVRSIDFRDTFIDSEHLAASFPDQVCFMNLL
jgi:intron-binding protein aquarius